VGGQWEGVAGRVAEGAVGGEGRGAGSPAASNPTVDLQSQISLKASVRPTLFPPQMRG
jgi:hypothetical protein